LGVWQGAGVYSESFPDPDMNALVVRSHSSLPWIQSVPHPEVNPVWSL